MDWRRAKTIFILLLLGLNLFLGGTLLYGTTIGSGQPVYAAHAEGLLASRKIRHDGDWPSGPSEAGMLQFENEIQGLEKLLETLLSGATVTQAEEGIRTYRMGTRSLQVGEMVDGKASLRYEDPQAGYLLNFSSVEKRDQEIRALLRVLGFGSHKLTYDRQEETPEGTWVTYIQPYKKGYLFDNRIRLLLQGEGLAGMDIRFHPVRQMMQPVGGGTGAVLSIQQALILSPLRGPLEISDIAFGWGQGDVGELYYSPVWRLLMNDGREIRLDAYTGVLLSP